MKKYSFEKLEVWQLSRELTKEIYILTMKYPASELYGLSNQIRRAKVSVSCNLSEGVSRWSKKEKSRYIEIAYGSLMEVMNCLILSRDLNYIDDITLDQTRLKINKIASKLSALNNSFKIP